MNLIFQKIELLRLKLTALSSGARDWIFMGSLVFSYLTFVLVLDPFSSLHGMVNSMTFKWFSETITGLLPVYTGTAIQYFFSKWDRFSKIPEKNPENQKRKIHLLLFAWIIICAGLLISGTIGIFFHHVIS